jgi:dienelactone hydrolase
MNHVDRPPGTGVVLIGLTGAGMGATLERIAARGYCTIAVDARDLSDVDGTLEDVRTAMEALRARADSNRKAAVVGYGLGGRYAYLAVTRAGADAGAAFRAIGMGSHLGEASKVRVPLSLHFADDDERVPLDEVRAIKGALEGFATTEIYRYPTWDEGAASEAERRAYEVLDRLR